MRFVHARLGWQWVALLASSTGWVLEWIRQRGSCEFGDNSPDTLATSVLLIVIGGGLFGIAGTVLALVRMARLGRVAALSRLVVSVIAILSVPPLFLFAGAGPGSWFQYCAT